LPDDSPPLWPASDVSPPSAWLLDDPPQAVKRARRGGENQQSSGAHRPDGLHRRRTCPAQHTPAQRRRTNERISAGTPPVGQACRAVTNQPGAERRGESREAPPPVTVHAPKSPAKGDANEDCQKQGLQTERSRAALPAASRRAARYERAPRHCSPGQRADLENDPRNRPPKKKLVWAGTRRVVI
jgi:hypothetical protein